LVNLIWLPFFTYNDKKYRCLFIFYFEISLKLAPDFVNIRPQYSIDC
jgi:hypothetical protein